MPSHSFILLSTRTSLPLFVFACISHILPLPGLRSLTQPPHHKTPGLRCVWSSGLEPPRVRRRGVCGHSVVGSWLRFLNLKERHIHTHTHSITANARVRLKERMTCIHTLHHHKCLLPSSSSWTASRRAPDIVMLVRTQAWPHALARLRICPSHRAISLTLQMPFFHFLILVSFFAMATPGHPASYDQMPFHTVFGVSFPK